MISDPTPFQLRKGVRRRWGAFNRGLSLTRYNEAWFLIDKDQVKDGIHPLC